VQTQQRRIRVGIGGWTYEPWRGTFYPPGLPHARELQHASRQLTAIEINGTFYSSQKPTTFARWRDETPEDFMFSLKASRYATNRKLLAEAGESIRRFVNSGIAELGPKLGPIVWQLAATKRFDAADLRGFFEQLPQEVDGLPLRHVLDARHDSFMTGEYLALAREHRVTTVFTDADEYPSFCDPTGDFVYARLMRTQADVDTGYPAEDIKRWADISRRWAAGEEPPELPRVEPAPAKPASPRDVFVFFISGAKERAPAAATALLAAL
jgi:uncharacterized protein YecE (DUF72 family)